MSGFDENPFGEPTFSDPFEVSEICANPLSKKNFFFDFFPDYKMYSYLITKIIKIQPFQFLINLCKNCF